MLTLELRVSGASRCHWQMLIEVDHGSVSLSVSPRSSSQMRSGRAEIIVSGDDLCLPLNDNGGTTLALQ